MGILLLQDFLNASHIFSDNDISIGGFFSFSHSS
jgi:hypothetical protein